MNSRFYLDKYPLTVGSAVSPQILYNPPSHKFLRGGRVTVCIAAMCRDPDGAPFVFGASDRMITSGGDTEFEPPASKIVGLSTSIAILVAGDSAIQSEIIRDVNREVRARIDAEPQNWWRVKDVAALYIKYRNEAKLSRAESTILAPLGLNRDSFLLKQRTMSETIVSQLTSEMLNLQLPHTAAIIVGLDQDGGPHIYVIHDDEISCHDTIGYAAVGIGSRHASGQFMHAQHAWNSPFPQTLLLTYFAKKRAEVAPGVGKGTDMVMIGPGLGQYVNMGAHVIDFLESSYTRVIAEEAKITQSIYGEVDNYVKRLADQAKSTQQTTETSPPSESGGSGATPAHGATVPVNPKKS